MCANYDTKLYKNYVLRYKKINNNCNCLEMNELNYLLKVMIDLLKVVKKDIKLSYKLI